MEEGRQAGGIGPTYIKGDPLNGYYDFVITEGSYKFWVVFQVRKRYALGAPLGNELLL